MPLREQEFLDAAVSQGLIEDEQLPEIRTLANAQGVSLLEAISIAYRIPLKALYHALAAERDIRFVDLGIYPIDEHSALEMADIGLRRGVIPVHDQSGKIILATADIDDLALISAVERSLDIIAEVALATPEAISDSVQFIRKLRNEDVESVDTEGEDASDLFARVINEAYLHHASDIHIEPAENTIRVRFRVDGRLVSFISSLPPEQGRLLVSRIKVFSGLDIAEQRAPQDGRMQFELINGIVQDMRVAVIPTRFGERITIRLLGTTDENLTLSTLGMLDAELKAFRQAIQKPHGIVLLTGPTGSGKSTTLYSALKEINSGWRNIITVEDPIEQIVPNVSQVQVGASDKVTFDSALRSILRHDPDVVMIGEVRDLATADIALKAALTGHLVFSSLHTNTAVGAVTRLMDFGCEPYLVGATLVGAISQRLVRRLCRACRQEVELDKAQRAIIGDYDLDRHYQPGGCPQCLGTGYSGRIGLFECFWTGDETRDLISKGAAEQDISQVGGDLHKTMFRDGLEKVSLGFTSLEEVIGVTIGATI